MTNGKIIPDSISKEKAFPWTKKYLVVIKILLPLAIILLSIWRLFDRNLVSGLIVDVLFVLTILLVIVLYCGIAESLWRGIIKNEIIPIRYNDPSITIGLLNNKYMQMFIKANYLFIFIVITYIFYRILLIMLIF